MAEDTPIPPKHQVVMGGRKGLPRVVGRPLGDPSVQTEASAEALGWQSLETIPEEEWEEATPLVTGHALTEPTDASLQFSHACCAAVRPNPVEMSTEPGKEGQRETRKEPYLLSAGLIKPTQRLGLALVVEGLFVAVMAYAAVQAQLVALSISGGLALAGLIYMIISYSTAKSGMTKVVPAVTRHIADELIERGKLFICRMDTAGTQTAGLRVRIREQKAPGLRPVELPIVKAGESLAYRVRPQAKGMASFSGVDLIVESKDGLWMQEQSWRVRTTVEIAPSGPGLMWRSLVTGYAPFDPGHPPSVVKLFREIEYEITREFREGDKMRDVNWKLTNRLDRGDGKPPMMVRKRWSDGETTILLVIDSGSSMVEDQAGYRNIDLAVEIAQEFAAAALPRNHEVGLLAFDEDQVLDHVRPTRSKIQRKLLDRHFVAIADHDIPEEREEPLEMTLAGDPTNLRLSMSNALKQRSTSSMTLVVFTDLQTTPEEVAQILAKQASSGQKVVVMLLPSPKLRGVVPGRSRDEQPELRGKAHVNRMRELLIANGCEFAEINPSDEEFSLTRVIDDAAPKPADD